ncbi:ZAR1-like protein [Pleuronectes platessa]|uniref:ZAR1-like protein n=1 Tax=Pleuronectes platessa TaxID=8262 RepID=UPI00232A4AE4|nr:ZAR1-like protein [Pleuronectes platessa]
MAGCHGSMMEGFLTTLPPFSQFMTPGSSAGPPCPWEAPELCPVRCCGGPTPRSAGCRLLGLEARPNPGSGARDRPEVAHDRSDWERAACHSSEDTGKNLQTSLRHSSKGAISQFLEQRYGFLHCKTCNILWESAYVWCSSGTCKVYYKQLCRRCQTGLNPYRVEPIICKACSLTSCSCVGKHRHINMNRPHRPGLCSRCKGMRLSCDSTHSFKYTF